MLAFDTAAPFAGFPLSHTDARHARNRAAAIFAAAQLMLPTLSAGRPLDAHALRKAMQQVFGSDPASWLWKEAYEAAEACIVLFLQHFGSALRTHAGDAGPAHLLAMLEQISGLEPSHTRRSGNQVRLQQFSTPLPLACIAVSALAIRRGDILLEPSAGTGVLAAMVDIAAEPSAKPAIHLNEIAETRYLLLRNLFPSATVTAHDAESLSDRMTELRPTVIAMNPPFSASIGVGKISRGTDLRHLKSAYAMLAPGGRLSAITSPSCIPGSDAWNAAFAGQPPRILFTVVIDGRLYSRRGTATDTRLTVIERSSDPSARIDVSDRASSSAELLSALTRALPARPVGPSAYGALTDLFGNPVPGAPSSFRTRTRQSPANDSLAPLPVEPAPANDSEPAPSAGAAYHPWRPSSFHITGAHEHPTPLVQSAAMAAVPHPFPEHRPKLPTRLLSDGVLSEAQLESIVLAGAAHSRHLPARYRIGQGWETIQRASDYEDDDDNGIVHTQDGEDLSLPVRFRRGWMLGDGTGTGKGRQVAAIILDNWLQGRRRALWLSQSDKLVEDAERDWTAIGGAAHQIVSVSRFRQGIDIPLSEGILFATYATLRSPARQGKMSRLDQIVKWLASSLQEHHRHAFDGVIVFDEAHAMANAAGSKSVHGDTKPSQQGRAGLRLQNALPDARILYGSATGASTIPGLAYATRLGLWSTDDTPFHQRNDFVAAMEKGGVAAMEVVARDLKALGLYQARALSYDGVEVDILEHPLTPSQRRIYDSYADAFKIIHANVDKALEATGIVKNDETRNSRAKAAALSAFESAKQRFFAHLLTAMKCPTLIRSIHEDLDAGHAAVVQLVSTGEALMDRRIAEIPPSEWDDLSIDLTPRETVIEFLTHSFPVQLQQQFTDDNGNPFSRPVFDEDGHAVLCQEAVARRDALIGKLAALPPVASALDQIVQHFGHDAVAEITGRSRRVLRIRDARGERLSLHSRPASSNYSETAAFMQGDKRILVFSMAGGTGRSYHADLGAPNTRRRIHYLLEPGWRADQAIQGLGRTHRTHQASAPLFRPVTTDVKGERRFIATIARRLDSLGAITRGQRNSQTALGNDKQTLFHDSDNLESPYARAALRQLYAALHKGVIKAWPIKRFQKATGLKIVHEGNLKEDLPPMPQFLNRLLALPIDEQNELFTELEIRIAENVDRAKEAGAYEVGVETIRADSLTITARETIYEHPHTSTATELVEIARRDRLMPLASDEAIGIPLHYGDMNGKPRLFINTRSKRAAVLVSAPSRIFDDGAVQKRVRLVRPASNETLAWSELEASNWTLADECVWRPLWDAEIASLPSHADSRFWITNGLLLPIWDRLPSDNMRVRRLTTDEGQQLIGRVLDAEQVRAVRAAFNLDGATQLTGAEAWSAVLKRGSSLPLANGWRLTRRMVAHIDHVELEGPDDTDTDALQKLGFTIEIINWRARVFAPAPHILERLFARWPLQA
ncbi:MAG: strawberry notch family protein [Alphaproteobacteria bacterium]|nr:strawberry notch family protein [Alphaproteobacteria bacterium]